jgi:fructokinase
MALATVVKMNDAELPLVLNLLGLPDPLGLSDPQPGQPASALTPELLKNHLRRGAEELLAGFPRLDLVAITCGAHGSLLVRRGEWHSHPGIPAEIADTIGAGDAFTAAITHYLLRGASLAQLNEAGNQWGAFIASQRGAMPAISDGTIQAIRRKIEG